MLRVYTFWVLSIIFILILAGCKVQPKEHMKSSILTTLVGKETINSISPIETPMVGLMYWNITPAPGKAILRGRVIVQPHFLLGELYLGKAVPTSDPNVDLVELDEKTAPRAIINRATGEFIFLNVEPGKYGLIAWGPMNSILVNDPQTGYTLFVTLLSDQIIDVGTLIIP
jgi:hypothetical protein